MLTYRYSLVVLTRCKLHTPLAWQTCLLHATPRRASRVVHRVACPPPPPPPCPPRPIKKWLLASVALVGLTGAFMHYAHDKPEVRDWITIHASWFDDLIAMAYKENQGYGASALEVLDGTRSYLRRLLGLNPEPKECHHVSNTCINPLKNREEESENEDEDPDLKKCDTQSSAPPVLNQDTKQLRKCIEDNSDHAFNSYQTAADACRVYIAEANDSLESMNLARLKGMPPLIEERKGLEQEFVAEAEKSTKRISELTAYNCAEEGPPSVRELQDLASRLAARVDAQRDEHRRLRREALTLDEQIGLVVKGVMDLQSEIQCMCPSVNLEDKKPKMECDADVLLINMHRKRDTLEADLDYTVGVQSSKVDNMVEHSKPADEKLSKKRDSDIAALKKKKTDEMNKRMTDKQTALTTRLKKQEEMELKEQKENMENDLKSKLIEKEKEITAKTKVMISDQIAAERRVLRQELAKHKEKLTTLENATKASADAEKAAQNAQLLHGAASDLLKKTGGPGPVAPIDEEVKVLAKVGESDPLVQSVLKAIPDSAKENGVVPESVLKKKFYEMENAALTVALVEAEGAPLFVYLISLLQSTFLFMKPTSIPYDEMKNPPEKIPADLDTFDIMQRARYWMARDELAPAHRYVGALQGASLGAARGWLDATRDLLETRAAARAALALAKAKSAQQV